MQKRTLYSASLLFVVAPFAFGLVRAFTAGDTRMVTMAAASLFGAALADYGLRRRSPRSALGTRALVAFLASAALAGATAYVLGARSAPGIWMVAVVFGLCWAARSVLSELSRR